MQVDVAVIGGSIVGLATAYQVTQRFPGRRVAVLEKEANVAAHQTGHNSGVLHSGIHDKPGSLKAVNCRAGKQAMEAFRATEAIPFEICCKVIVGLNDSEMPALDRLFERGRANGVKFTRMIRDGVIWKPSRPACGRSWSSVTAAWSMTSSSARTIASLTSATRPRQKPRRRSKSVS
jgi:L-2-hydroxyglutarate oxidase LhgO